MIDLTPLDVRNKRGDFKKLMRGYDPQEVDVFLELVAERLEALVRENIQLRERTETLKNQVDAQVGREQAVQDALVTAQELRADIQAQSQREADHIRREAEAEAKRVIAEADAECRRLIAEAEGEVRSRLRGIERQLDHAGDSITELERRRVRFLKEFRSLLEREMDVVEVEEDRAPYQERTIDLELGGRRNAMRAAAPQPSDVVAATLVSADAVPDLSVEPSPDVSPSAAESSGGGGSEDPVSEAPVPEPPVAQARKTQTPKAEAPVADAPAAPEEAAVSATPAAPPEIEVPVDVAALGPSAPPHSRMPAAPPPAVPDEPSPLELELMAGAGGEAGTSGDGARGFPDVPDLETLLAEAGVDPQNPPGEIAPPPAPRPPKDNLILFDPNDPDRRR